MCAFMRTFIVTCKFVYALVAAAKSKANQMDKIMTMIRLYGVTLFNEGHCG